MSWAIGYDPAWKRDIGYGVPAWCDHPKCREKINRGLACVCGGEPYGGERGCGLYFCEVHIFYHTRLPQLCERCEKRRKPYPPKPDHPEWVHHKLADESWQKWRDNHPDEVRQLSVAYASAMERYRDVRTCPTTGPDPAVSPHVCDGTC
jgi:hypothetical protein